MGCQVRERVLQNAADPRHGGDRETNPLASAAAQHMRLDLVAPLTLWFLPTEVRTHLVRMADAWWKETSTQSASWVPNRTPLASRALGVVIRDVCRERQNLDASQTSREHCSGLSWPHGRMPSVSADAIKIPNRMPACYVHEPGILRAEWALIWLNPVNCVLKALNHATR